MKRIALLGMPNTGKSTFFNRVTGASARVGNWPGITVDLMRAKILLGGHIAELIDLPGIYDLHGFSDDEQVVRHFLTAAKVDLMMIVANSSQIDRQLSLALQLKSLGIPAMLLLNMSDEAKRAGIRINTKKMTEKLGVPVMQISAKYGDHCTDALKAASALLDKSSQEADPAEIQRQLEADINIEHEMEDIVQSTVEMPIQLGDALSNRIDKVLLHPWLGLPLFFAAMYSLFQFIFTLGKPLQDSIAWLLALIRSDALEPLLASTPAWVNGLLLDGIYNGLGTVAAFVPIIILFFLVMTMVAERGRDMPPSGQWLENLSGLPMSAGLDSSPGCWMLTNSVRPSGVSARPVISQSAGPTRKRRSLSVPSGAPTLVATSRAAPAASTLVMVRFALAPPSPTLPGIAASSMQLVSSVNDPSSV